MPTHTVIKQLHIKSKHYLSFKDLKPGKTFSRTVNFPNSVTAEFRVTGVNNSVPDFLESVIWTDPASETTATQTMTEGSHTFTWARKFGDTAYILRVPVLPDTNDNLPENFMAERVNGTMRKMEKLLYIRDNDCHDFLQYNPPGESRPKPVMFDNDITAMLYIETVCENPNYWSVVHHIESDPVAEGWLIRIASTDLE